MRAGSGAVPCPGPALRGAGGTHPVEWDTVYERILSTPREELAGPIDDLQGVYLKAMALTPPDCAREAHALLVEGMSLTVDGCRLYMAPATGSAAYFRIRAGTESLDKFKAELEKLKSGRAPYD